MLCREDSQNALLTTQFHSLNFIETSYDDYYAFEQYINLHTQ